MSQENEQSVAERNQMKQYSGFYIGDTLLGVDISNVQEINNNLNLTRVPLAPDYVLGIMNLRGKIVTVVDQSIKLGFEPSEMGKKSRIIIVRSNDEHIGLLVDSVTEVVTAEKGSITEPPSNIRGIQGKYFTGIIQTGDNELLAILDVDAMLADEKLSDGM